MSLSPPSTLGELFDVRSTLRLYIRDCWSGSSAHAPIIAIYELGRDARGGFSGDGTFSTAVLGIHHVQLAFRRNTAARFFDAIALAQLTDEPYVPRHEWTDDLPRIDIGFHTGDCDDGGSTRIAFVSTESQGHYHAPRALRVDGQEWTVLGDGVGRAFARLQRSLKRPVLDRMIREADRARQGTPD